MKEQKNDLLFTHLHNAFTFRLYLCDKIMQSEVNTMSQRSDEIRNKYIKNPPEGMTADDIRRMSEDDLLDMDYFLNEDDEFDEDFPGAEGFYIF